MLLKKLLSIGTVDQCLAIIASLLYGCKFFVVFRTVIPQGGIGSAVLFKNPRIGLSTNITHNILEEDEYEDIDAIDNNHCATSAPLRLFSLSTSQSQQVSDYDYLSHVSNQQV